ncbi:hypothetical protein [Butyrivibrio sp. VCB2001]|uniref:hypothetical protein n=1 Tax=Butyrivibrio sp. VCB2001 TaxID=1280667 RepID=UPI0004227033|nr:hypothetical protein [Butyrivibrio sp. VCB2001]
MRKLIKSKDKFITCPLENLSLRAVLGEHFVLDEGVYKVSDPLFKIVPGTPEILDGNLTPLDIDLFIYGGYSWYISYYGEMESSESGFEPRKVYAISAFYEEDGHGNKMTFLARRIVAKDEKDRQANINLKDDVSRALYEHLSYLRDKRVGWVEAAGDLEKCVSMVYPLMDIIDPEDLMFERGFEEMLISLDQFHYDRTLRNGDVASWLIAYGNRG